MNRAGLKDQINEIIGAVIKDLLQIKVAILILVVYGVAAQLLFGTICPTRIFCGYPCPGCGLTRAAFDIILGFHIKKAWYHNPTIFLWIAYIIAWLWYRYVLKKSIKHNNVYLIFVGVITLLCYILRVYNYIPYSKLDEYQKYNMCNIFIERIIKIL